MPIPLTDDDKWRAMLRRDLPVNEVFFYAVLTTGVYCLPGCASRLPNRKNVSFFETSEEAEKAGFRPCKKCRPNDITSINPLKKAVLLACRIMEDSHNHLNFKDIAKQTGFSAYYLHRIFKKLTGVTPKEYAMEIRMGKTRSRLQDGQSVTEAIFDSGFESSSRFYEKSKEILGMTPSEYKKGAPSIEIKQAVFESFLGWVLVAMTEKGICSVTIGDTPEELRENLYRSFPKAVFREPDKCLEDMVARLMSLIKAPEANSPELPLDIQGTSFQCRVWKALKAISPGSTASYSEIAAQAGKPSAVRAVANACAANPVAIIIPCHRVVRSDGKLSGYRWGIERKRKLLELEEKNIRQS